MSRGFVRVLNGIVSKILFRLSNVSGFRCHPDLDDHHGPCSRPGCRCQPHHDPRLRACCHCLPDRDDNDGPRLCPDCRCHPDRDDHYGPRVLPVFRCLPVEGGCHDDPDRGCFNSSTHKARLVTQIIGHCRITRPFTQQSCRMVMLGITKLLRKCL